MVEDVRRPLIICTREESKVKQSFKDECDINNIMKTVLKTGQLPISDRQGQYLDLSDSKTYHEHMNNVIKVQAIFESLTAEDRSMFGNDPANMLDYLSKVKDKNIVVLSDDKNSTPDATTSVNNIDTQGGDRK